MTWERIRKRRKAGEPAPNLKDYEAACETFSWDEARGGLDGLPGGGLNIAHEAVDRHVAAGRGEQARHCAGSGGTATGATSPTPSLRAQTQPLRQLLAGARASPQGDRVFSLLGRVPELYVAALGTLKTGSVFSPLFSAFGPEPVRRACDRRRAGPGHHRGVLQRKVAPWRDELPASSTCCWSTAEGSRPTARRIWRALARRGRDGVRDRAPPTRRTWRCCTSPAARPARPKGAVHVHEAVVAHHVTGHFALDLHPERHLLVHGRPRLGDRHLLRHHRAAHQSA